MASQMSLFKGGFLARTSHELRSPLNSLIGAHQLILAGLCDDPAEEREFLAQANESALKLMRLLDNIIAVAKTDCGTETMQIQPLQLAKLLQEVEELTHLQAKNNNICLQILLPDPDIYILADPPRLKQVLLNSIDTAIAQMKEGSIKVSAHFSPATGFASIGIELPRSAVVWSESVDLLRSVPMADGLLTANSKLSPGMTLLINQTLLELMQGRLEVVENHPANEAEIIRLQCSLPLAIPTRKSD
jgi:signal transduction histidine kinase